MGVEVHGGSLIEWLLDADPAIRWQVLRDLTDAPEAEWHAERAKVETVGWGARLLALQDGDGQWAGGAFAPADFDWSAIREVGQPWTATSSRCHSYASSASTLRLTERSRPCN